MGEVKEVAGVTEQDLRRAAMANANRHCNRARDLGPGEFAASDWIVFVQEEEGKTLNENAAQRELDDLVAAGVLARTEKDDKRYDPRSKRLVIAYWYTGEDGATEGAGQADAEGRGPP